MQQVSKDEFFKRVGQLDVRPSLQGRFPYTALWELRDRRVVGKSVDRVEGGAIVTDYFLPHPSQP